MQLADAQRKHAAAIDAKEGKEFKAKREGTLRKQAGRRAVSSEKAKSKSDTALAKAQAKNTRLRQLMNGSSNLLGGEPPKNGRKKKVPKSTKTCFRCFLWLFAVL